MINWQEDYHSCSAELDANSVLLSIINKSPKMFQDNKAYKNYICSISGYDH